MWKISFIFPKNQNVTSYIELTKLESFLKSSKLPCNIDAKHITNDTISHVSWIYPEQDIPPEILSARRQSSVNEDSTLPHNRERRPSNPKERRSSRDNAKERRSSSGERPHERHLSSSPSDRRGSYMSMHRKSISSANLPMNPEDPRCLASLRAGAYFCFSFLLLFCSFFVN